MSLNCNEIDLILKELDLDGSFIQDIIQPGFDTICFYTYKVQNAKTVLICTSQNAVRINETRRKIVKNEKPLRFMEFLKSKIKGARINCVNQIGKSRIIKFSLSHCDSEYFLYARLWSNASNVILCDKNNVILDSMFRRPQKNEVTGGIFVIPEQSENSEKVWPVRDFSMIQKEYDESNSFKKILSFNEKVDIWYSEHSSSLSRASLLLQAEKWYTSVKSRMEKALFRLEEKLKALQEAKQKKILLYKDGRFQYSEDVGAIASAQQDYNETWRDIYVEEQTEILNDLKDKSLAIIEEYRDKALENGELTQENINSLLSEYHELGNNTYQTVAYGVENITNIVASGMSALTGSVSGATSTATSAISGTMGTIGSSMSKMATGLTSAASLLNKQFGEGLSAILKTSQVKSGKMVGTYQLGENEQTLDDFRNEYWGDTSGKFSKLSLLYGGGQSWWLGMMSKYLEDPEKNANLKIGSMTLKELYDTDWTKKVGSASSLGEIDDYIAREQAKYILNGGSQSDYEALNKIAQDAYRELYFKNPRAYAPGAKGYGGYDPEFSAAQYAVDAALRYSGSNYDVFGVEGGRTSGMSAGRVSDLNFLRELVSQGERAGASSVSQSQAEWAKNQLNERYQTSYKNTLDAIDKQIEENSKKWYTADAEERDRLHLLNEELRKNRGEYEKKVGGNANGTLSWRGGLSVVGEKGPELRVLNKGDGIIPSNITENLWKIGSDPSKFMRDVVRTTSNIFSISSLSLPNARDAQSLVDGLQELAHQYVAKRK